MSISEDLPAGRVIARGAQLLDRIEYRLAATDEEKDAIFRLRYRAYLHEGAIAPNKDQRTTDQFDEMPNSWIFGIFVEGILTSSLRVSVASPAWRETPSTHVFPDILAPHMAQGKVMVDPTRFVADPRRADRMIELPYLTLRLAHVACEHFNADIGLASVRSEHQTFYRRVFMHTICPIREYPGLIKPISLMAIHFPEMREKLFLRYPFLRSTQAERRKLFDRNMSPALAKTVSFSSLPRAQAG